MQQSSRAPSPDPEDDREADFKRRLEELERRETEIEQKEVKSVRIQIVALNRDVKH